MMSGRLILDAEIVEQLTLGKVSKPRFSLDFPAEYIETEMNWDDLILHPSTQHHIQEIEHWITHNDTLLRDWGMKKKIKPGYRALFYGPPGCGKSAKKFIRPPPCSGSRSKKMCRSRLVPTRTRRRKWG